MTDDEELLFRTLALVLPSLHQAAKPYAYGLMTILSAQDGVRTRQSAMPLNSAKKLLGEQDDRWGRQRWIAPNPLFAAKGAEFASEYEWPILQTLAMGEAHLQLVRARMHDIEGFKRAMTYRYGWSLHYLWECGLVTAVWKNKGADRHCFWSITPDGRRRLAELEAERWLEAESAEWTRASYDCGTAAPSSAFEI